MTLEFIDPPDRKVRTSWTGFVDELKQHPNRWVLWKTKSFHQNARLLRLRYAPNIMTETRAAGKDERNRPVYDIYVKWMEVPNA